MRLGLPLLNPSLNQTTDVSHGVKFAVAGITVLDRQFFRMRNRPIEEIQGMVRFVVRAIENAVKEVIYAGATMVMGNGYFPIGCITIPNYCMTTTMHYHIYLPHIFWYH